MAVQRDKVIASAEKLVVKGKIEPAIKEYERLLDDNPNDVNTLNRIGDLWVRINRNDEAVKVFSKIAEHYARDGFFLKAIAIYKKINKLDPSKLEVYAKLADLYAKQGLAMEAKSQYQVLADYYLKHGDPANALSIYRKISELDPNSINVHVKLADLYSQNNQTAEALKEYDRVGRLLLKRGMLDEAVQVFRKALKIDPKNTDLVESLVTALLEAKDFDNATQIVNTALETNDGNPRLLSMLGRIQLGRGDAAGAQATLERGLAADPNDSSLREAVADLALKQGNADKALEMLGPSVEKALGRGERGAAVEALNRVLRVDAAHTPTLERLVAVYSRLNEETNILGSMNSLAEAHIGKMRFDEASKVLEKLIQREPQNAQHRNKLQFVRSQMGGIDTMPVRQKTTEAPLPPPGSSVPQMEIEEPSPSFDFGADSDALSLDLDASPPIDLDFQLEEPPAPAPRPAPAAVTPPPPSHLMSAVEIAAAEIDSGGDDLDFITEHLTEAEVFAKYGLAEKAAEHLRAVLDRAPKNATAHDRLFRILLEEGEIDAARTAARAYVNILTDSGDDTTVTAIRNEFLTRGHTFDGGAAAAPAAAITDELESEIEFDLEPPAEEPALQMAVDEALPDFSLPEPEPAAIELGPSEEISFEPEPAPQALEEAFELPEPVEEPAIEPIEETFELPDSEPAPQALEEAFELPAAAGELTFDDEPSLDLPAEPAVASDSGTVSGSSILGDDFALELERAEPELMPESDAADEPMTAPFGADAEEDPFGSIALGEDRAGAPTVEELAEIDFYIEQELYDEARRKTDALLSRYPGNADIDARGRRLASAASSTPPTAAAATVRPPALSRDEIESELLSAIPDDDDDLVMPQIPAPAPPPAARAPEPVAPFSASTVQEENLFADEEDFFDLAAELESELNDDDAISLSEEEQSLEEIFKEFKKGVEQQLDSEDYDTHYNLGIAYKEMGLIDEAIGEFQLASKDPKRAVECASMLGLCFLEKGMPQLAIKWYRKGLEMPEISEEEHIGLLYDLASAYQEVGDTENAQKSFMEVYGMNSTYRDIVSRIKQLEDATQK